jgi:hypothetical protein
VGPPMGPVRVSVRLCVTSEERRYRKKEAPSDAQKGGTPHLEAMHGFALVVEAQARPSSSIRTLLSVVPARSSLIVTRLGPEPISKVAGAVRLVGRHQRSTAGDRAVQPPGSIRRVLNH